MTREDALAILKEPDRIGANIINTNDEETTRYNANSLMALEMAIKALEQEVAVTISEIPKDYKYDTETEDFLVYRNMYTGDEIHIERPTPLYRLEEEPCEDCISRQAVNTLVDELARAISDERCCMSRGRATSSIMQDILDLPSVTPKQKMGKWIMPVQDDGMSDPIYYQVRCSECGFDLDPQTWHMELHQYGADKYCPNCGARMGESEE